MENIPEILNLDYKITIVNLQKAHLNYNGYSIPNTQA